MVIVITAALEDIASSILPKCVVICSKASPQSGFNTPSSRADDAEAQLGAVFAGLLTDDTNEPALGGAAALNTAELGEEYMVAITDW